MFMHAHVYIYVCIFTCIYNCIFMYVYGICIYTHVFLNIYIYFFILCLVFTNWRSNANMYSRKFIGSVKGVISKCQCKALSSLGSTTYWVHSTVWPSPGVSLQSTRATDRVCTADMFAGVLSPCAATFCQTDRLVVAPRLRPNNLSSVSSVFQAHSFISTGRPWTHPPVPVSLHQIIRLNRLRVSNPVIAALRS